MNKVSSQNHIELDLVCAERPTRPQLELVFKSVIESRVASVQVSSICLSNWFVNLVSQSKVMYSFDKFGQNRKPPFCTPKFLQVIPTGTGGRPETTKFAGFCSSVQKLHISGSCRVQQVFGILYVCTLWNTYSNCGLSTCYN